MVPRSGTDNNLNQACGYVSVRDIVYIVHYRVIDRVGDSKYWRRNRLALLGTAIGIVILGSASSYYYATRTIGLVPKDISKAVSFPVYYPDSKKLPSGYVLDTASFSSPVKNGVAYTVQYDDNKKIVFSVQAKPADNELQAFRGNYIPLRIDYQTRLGLAEIGAYHSQTLVSLPIIDGPWVVATAPSDTDQTKLKQVLDSLTH